MHKITALTGPDEKGHYESHEVAVYQFLMLHELEEMVKRGLSAEEILDEARRDQAWAQIVVWTSPKGRHYRSFIHQLEEFDGQPMERPTNFLKGKS